MAAGSMRAGELQIDLLKEEAIYGRPFNPEPAVCKPVLNPNPNPNPDDDAEMEGEEEDADVLVEGDEEDRPLEDYSMFEGRVRSSSVFLPEFNGMMERNWDKEYKATYEEEHHLSPIDPHNLKIVQYPCIIARGSPPRSWKCWCCGEKQAHDVQMPQEVFATAFCVAGPVKAIECLQSMADLLVQRQFADVIKKTAFCRRVRCMIAQHKLTSTNYFHWYFSGTKTGGRPRMQLERGTDRKDQGVVFADNILLLRWAFMQDPPILDEQQVKALFHWVVVNSQFVQEREKRYIATAIAVAESSTFPFKFTGAQKQSMVDRMSSIPRNYTHVVILPHILDKTRDNDRWQSMGNRLLETAFPKAADALYFLTCLTNWENQQRPRDANGRPEHRVPKGNVDDAAARKRHAALLELFTVKGFRGAITKAVAEHGDEGYQLFYAASTPTKSSVKLKKRQSCIDTHKLLTLLTGTNKRCYTYANPVKGVWASPTCGSVQADSGVHTKQRYDAVAEGLLMEGQEKQDAVSLFVDVWEAGNAVGKEKLKGKRADKSKSKACASLRPVKEHTDRQLESVNAAKRAKHKEVAMQELVRLGKHTHASIGLLACRTSPHNASLV